jgi:hypothetical protein
MPAVSQAQRKWAFAVKGAKWAKEHHFDPPPGPLPARVGKKKAKKKARKRTGGYGRPHP